MYKESFCLTAYADTYMLFMLSCLQRNVYTSEIFEELPNLNHMLIFYSKMSKSKYRFYICKNREILFAFGK